MKCSVCGVYHGRAVHPRLLWTKSGWDYLPADVCHSCYWYMKNVADASLQSTVDDLLTVMRVANALEKTS